MKNNNLLNVIKIGLFVFIVTPINAQITDIVAVDSIHYKVGDKIKMGKAMNGLPEFSNVIQYTKDDVSTLRKPKTPAYDSLVIVGITENTKQNDYTVKCHYYYLQNTPDTYMTYSFIFNKAIETGEVVSKNPTYFVAPTSDQAMDQLKKAKEKLDLGLITQEEYDKIKTELSKYIK